MTRENNFFRMLCFSAGVGLKPSRALPAEFSDGNRATGASTCGQCLFLGFLQHIRGVGAISSFRPLPPPTYQSRSVQEERGVGLKPLTVTG